MYRIRNLIEIFIFDKGGPSWIFPLEVKKYAALMVFETFLMRTPERIKSKAKKERRLRTILVRNTTWLWLSRPKISPSISQHFLVQLSSPFKSLHFKSRFHWYHSSTSYFFSQGHFFFLNRIQFPEISCIWNWLWNLLTDIHVHFSINRVCMSVQWKRENKSCRIDIRPKWVVFSVANKKEDVCYPYYKKQRKTVDWHCPQFSR